jgi:hypothetical protein
MPGVIRIVCVYCGERHERRRQVGQIECRCGAVYNALTGDPVDLLPELEHQAAALGVSTALRPRRRGSS